MQMQTSRLVVVPLLIVAACTVKKSGMAENVR